MPASTRNESNPCSPVKGSNGATQQQTSQHRYRLICVHVHVGIPMRKIGTRHWKRFIECEMKLQVRKHRGSHHIHQFKSIHTLEEAHAAYRPLSTQRRDFRTENGNASPILNHTEALQNMYIRNADMLWVCE
jgi:hypothetical protein